MTYETTRRYALRTSVSRDGTSIVLGASITGLCAARVLSEIFDEVIIIERDEIESSAEYEVRDGVPQGNHLHVLQDGGRKTLEDLFPGFSESLLSNGGLLVNYGTEFTVHDRGHKLPPGETQTELYTATRSLYEQVIRNRVLSRDNVTVQDQTQFTLYTTDNQAESVIGVRVTPRQKSSVASTDDIPETKTIPASLVVDATGRTSKTPKWLANNGYSRPKTDTVHIGVSYASVLVDRPTERRDGIAISPSQQNYRGGGVIPVENGKWLVTIFGMHEDEIPKRQCEVKTFAETLSSPWIANLLSEHTVSSEVSVYQFPASIRRRYTELNEFPENLVVIGDAITSQNPLYGQGMSLSAFQTVHLHHTLAEESSRPIGQRFFERVSPLLSRTWTITTATDHQYPETTGPVPTGSSVFNWFTRRVLQTAAEDPAVVSTYLQVHSLQSPPTKFLSPRILSKVLAPS
ncbi:FAD-dependent oxidoreductase [Halobellus rarus]|uniref:FAD-dependent oxidoreductase n=1 Tax=Halobellus rarus TaxID=1126237 RepID=A0ABD6CR59_9EURY